MILVKLALIGQTPAVCLRDSCKEVNYDKR